MHTSSGFQGKVLIALVPCEEFHRAYEFGPSTKVFMKRFFPVKSDRRMTTLSAFCEILHFLVSEPLSQFKIR